MLTEREFIRDLQERFPPITPVEVGIGDDGAVLNCNDSRQIVVTDMLLDGVHFRTKESPPELIGRKAVAVNLSDLAAMGCRPTAAFVSIAISRTMPARDKFLTRLYDGMEEILGHFCVALAGGDTTAWDGPFAINVCLTGVPFARRPILRSGARCDDAIMVTGALGGSLQRGRHLTFEPRLKVSQWLTENFDVHAMMDISDGLAIDIHRMAEASECGVIIHSDQIPISEDVDATLAPPRRLQHALSDGEDFELLFAVSKSEASRILAESLVAVGLKVYRIGQVTAGHQVLLDDGVSPVELSESGWQHMTGQD